MSAPADTSGHAPPVDLAFTFDPLRPEPDRFRADPKDPRRPDPAGHAPHRPMPPGRVAELVLRGNRKYAGFIRSCRTAAGESPPEREGVASAGGHRLFLGRDEAGIRGTTQQEPYMAVLGCIDARVPVELVTGQAANDTFVIRTAGNTLSDGGEGSGSLQYILANYAAGGPGAHQTVSAVLVTGHTRCGAVKAAYEAFKPGGGGVGGLPPALAGILTEIRPAVEFVLGRCRLGAEEEILDAIAHVNAVYSARKVSVAAVRAGVPVGDRFAVYYGTYSVTDFYLDRTNLPGHAGQKLPAAFARKAAAESYPFTDEAGGADAGAEEALAQDAVEFARRAR